MINRLAGVAFIVMLVSGCQSTHLTTTANTALAQQGQNNGQLKQQFLAQFEQIDNNSDTESLRLAIDAGLQFIALQPHQDDVTAKVYRLMLLDYLGQPSSVKEQRFSHFYFSNPSLRYYDVAPPSYMKFILQIEGLSDMAYNPDNLERWLKQARQESFSFLRSASMLAALYEEQQKPELAGFLLSASAATNPDDLKALANVYTTMAFDKQCALTSQRVNNIALDINQRVLKIEPDNTDAQLNLSSLYQFAGKPRLMEFTLKRLAVTDPGNRAWYAEALLWNGQLEQAARILNDIEVQANSQGWYFPLLFKSLMQRDWQQVRDYSEQVKDDPEPSIFAVIYIANVLKALASEQAAFAFLDANYAKAEKTPWGETMYSFAVGNIDQQALLTAASNKCEQTEAYFNLALISLLNGDEQNWRLYRDKAAALDVFGYYEYVASSYWQKADRR